MLKLKDFIDMKVNRGDFHQETLAEYKDYNGDMTKETLRACNPTCIRINGNPDNICEFDEPEKIPAVAYVKYGDYTIADIVQINGNLFSDTLLIIIEPPKTSTTTLFCE